MRLMILVLLMFFPPFAVAQMPAGMQEAMDCMQSLDQDALKEMGQKGEKIGKEIKAMCNRGDESGARDMAMDYAKDMASSELIEELKRCSDLMRKAMPSMPVPEMPDADRYQEKAENICENID